MLPTSSGSVYSTSSYSTAAPHRNPFAFGAASGGFGLAGFRPMSHGRGGGSGGLAWLGRYMRRALQPSGIDWEGVAHTVIYSCRAPAKVAKAANLRKQTRMVWSRDDPGVPLVVLALLAGVAVAWGAAYRTTSLLSYLWLIAMAWAQLIVGAGGVAALCWYVANRYLRLPTPLPHSVEQSVEPAYSWDVAVSSFVPVLLTCHLGLLLTAPLSLAPGWTGTLCGNGLLALGSVLSWHSVFRQYLTLPFLTRQNSFLAPAAATVMLLAFATLLNFNLARLLVGLYIA